MVICYFYLFFIHSNVGFVTQCGMNSYEIPQINQIEFSRENQFENLLKLNRDMQQIDFVIHFAGKKGREKVK